MVAYYPVRGRVVDPTSTFNIAVYCKGFTLKFLVIKDCHLYVKNDQRRNNLHVPNVDEENRFHCKIFQKMFEIHPNTLAINQLDISIKLLYI